MRRIKSNGKRSLIRRQTRGRTTRLRRKFKPQPEQEMISGIHSDEWTASNSIPSDITVAAVITVMNEEQTIPKVLEQIALLSLHETIIVVNGSSDRTFDSARSDRNAIVLHVPSRLGHDVGRALGAKLASSDIILFLDGDFVIPAEQLIPFIRMIAGGYDIALNDISPFLGKFANWDHVSVMKNYMNRMLGRSDLLVNSLTAVPHAISREAAARIGFGTLAVPPVAQRTAIALGMRIGCPISIDVVNANKSRVSNTGVNNVVAELIVGDHMEALAGALRNTGSRLGFPDVIRSRVGAGGDPA